MAVLVITERWERRTYPVMLGVNWQRAPHVSGWTWYGLPRTPRVGEHCVCVFAYFATPTELWCPQNNLAVAAAAMDELGGGGAKKGKAWPWWLGASAAQITGALVWFRRGKGGSDMTMPFRAFAVASLFVGAGATAVTAGVSAAGVGSVGRRSQNCSHPCDGFSIWMRQILHRASVFLYLQVEEMKGLGARIRKWSRVPPRRVEGGE